MKPFNSLVFVGLFSLCTYSLSAQLSVNSQIWSGGLSLQGNSENTSLVVAPSLQHFLSSRFSVGGGLNILGDFDSGIRQIFVDPEARYYFNPENEKVNWFALAGSRIELFEPDNQSGPDAFQLKTGLGANVMLAEGLSLESKLSTTFQRIGSSSFFKSPSLSFDANLVYFRDPTQTGTPNKPVPVIGRNSWLIGGSTARFDYVNNGGVKSFESYLMPSVGYFISDRFLVGADLSMTFSNLVTDFTIEESNFNVRSFGLSVNPYIRYYAGRLNGRIRPFLEAGGSWNYFETSREPSTTANLPFSSVSRNTSAYLGGGVDIFLSKNVALEAGLNVGKNLKTGQTQLGFELGLQFFLSGKQK